MIEDTGILVSCEIRDENEWEKINRWSSWKNAVPWIIARVLKQRKTVPRILIPDVARSKTKTTHSKALRRDIHREHKRIIPGSASSS